MAEDLDGPIAELSVPKIVERYRSYGPTTNPRSDKNIALLQAVPSDPLRLGRQIKNLAIHPFLFEHPERYPEMQRHLEGIPEDQRKREDFEIPTVDKMIARLLQLDSRGINRVRPLTTRIRISCGPLAYLAAAAYKAHGLPARVRVGFADWYPGDSKYGDHWINEYWDQKEGRWVQQDIDGIGTLPGDTWHDLARGKFMLAGEAWNKLRSGELKSEEVYHAAGKFGLEAAGWQLGYDMGNIMLVEPTYGFRPPDLQAGTTEAFLKDETKLREYDRVGKLLSDPDRNMDELTAKWNASSMFRPINP